LTKNIIISSVQHGIFNATIIEEIGQLTGASLIQDILFLPGVDGNLTKWNALVLAGQESYAAAYPFVYYSSIAFGSVAIIASLFLGDISQYMDDHVAVVIH